MIFKKIILDNFRCHQHLEFEPLLNGVTAISGENGKGKSTIVDALAWSLFGTKVNSSKNSEYIRELVSAKTEEVGVQTFLIIDGQEYKIHREIKDDSGKCECSVYNLVNNNWNKLSGNSVSASEQFIRQLIGMDEKGFLSSVFIQQKQVDNIINASTKERGQVIEKLIGVDSITQAGILAKDKSKGLQKVLNVIRLGDLKQQLKELKKQKELVVDLKNNLEEIENSYKESFSKFEELEQKYKIEMEKQNSLTDYNNKLLKIRLELKYNEEKLSEQMSVYEEYKKKSKSKSTINKEELSKEVNQEKQSLNKINENITLLSYKINDLKNNKIISKNSEVWNVTNEDVKKINKEIIQRKENIETMKINLVSLSSKLKNSKSFLKELKKGEAKCPYCNVVIENVDNKIIETNKNILYLSNVIEKEKSTIEYNENLLNDNNNILKQYKEYISIQSKQEEYKEALIKFEKELQIYNQDKIKVETKLKVLEKQLTEFLILEENISIFNNAKNLIKSIKETIKKLQEQEKKGNKVVDELNAMSTSEYKSLYKEYLESNNKLHNIQLELEKLKGQIKFENEKGNNLLKEYKQSQEADKQYKSISQQLSITNLSNQILNNFKDERIKSAIPSLNELASEILSKFTDNYFVKLILTEDFSTSVQTKDGIIRPTHLLSGGELSAVAVALRLAIALFLNNGKNSLMILDEILVSMDEDRAVRILETISSLTNSQIIFIAHNEGIHQFADFIFNI